MTSRDEAACYPDHLGMPRLGGEVPPAHLPHREGVLAAPAGRVEPEGSLRKEE